MGDGVGGASRWWLAIHLPQTTHDMSDQLEPSPFADEHRLCVLYACVILQGGGRTVGTFVQAVVLTEDCTKRERVHVGKIRSTKMMRHLAHSSCNRRILHRVLYTRNKTIQVKH